MKKQHIWVLLILVVFSNTLILAKFQDQKKRFESYVSVTNKILTYRSNQLRQRLLFDSSPIRIEEIEKKELCFLTSKLHCSQCVDSIITTVNEFMSDKPLFRFSVLADYDNLHDLLLFKRLNKITFPVFSAPENDIPIKNSEIPLFFIYSPDNQTASHIFAPDPQDPDLTLEYLSIINNLLNQN